MAGRHQGLAMAARQALEDLADDDSRTVGAAATAALSGAPEPSPPVAATGSGHRTTPAPRGTDPRPASLAKGTSKRWRVPGLPSSARARALVAAIAALLVVVGFAAWRLVDEPTPSTTIPASFDGKWVGEGATGDGGTAEFTALLAEGLNTGRLESGASSCYGGSLTVTEATDSELTMRFAPGADGCNPWTIAFTHDGGSDSSLVMSVDPDSNVNYESKFQIKLARRG